MKKNVLQLQAKMQINFYKYNVKSKKPVTKDYILFDSFRLSYKNR